MFNISCKANVASVVGKVALGQVSLGVPALRGPEMTQLLQRLATD